MKIQTKLLIGILGGMLAIYLIAFLFQQNHSRKEILNVSARSRSAEETNLWQWVDRLQFAIRSHLIEFMAAGEMEMFDRTIVAQRNGAGLQEARSTRDIVNRLAGAAKQIDAIVTLIARLAQQTNLLALNATIEAATAGEAGRGFAVVAQEVKELARQSASATEEIRSQVANIQKDTAISTKAIDEVVQVIEQTNQIALNIASAVEEQSATAAEISRSLQSITSSTEELAHNATQSAEGASEVSRNIQGVSTAISNTAKGAARQEAGTKGVLAISATLSVIVGHFKIEKDDTDAEKSPAAKELAKEIKKAMAAHGAWKQRLRMAIATGKTTFQLADVRKDNCCDFGRWLYACEDTAQKSSHWQCVRDCHATFHREAADVLQEAIEGDPTKATEAIISADSSFRAACDKLSKAMSAWAESNR